MQSPTEYFDLSVIVVNYNSGDVLPQCLTAVAVARTELKLDVIVVDNGSTDGSIESAEKAHPDFCFVRAESNLGFAKACNLGLAKARGRHYMLLNPDTEVMPGALKELVAALDENPQWGIIGPRMVDGQDRPYPAARRFPTPFFLFTESTRLAFLFPHSRLWARYFYGERNPANLGNIDQVEGSALAISGRARAVVGDLDERFFLYFEEVDWCLRVQQAGFENHIVSVAVVRHHRSTTMSRFFLDTRVHNAESAMKFFFKHHGERGLRSLRRWMCATLLLRETAMTLAAWFGAGERAKIRVAGARLERKIYRRGLVV
jgi:GT2 family glycosyltransferase